jgi:hypothetical protein
MQSSAEHHQPLLQTAPYLVSARPRGPTLSESPAAETQLLSALLFPFERSASTIQAYKNANDKYYENSNHQIIHLRSPNLAGTLIDRRKAHRSRTRL